MDDVTVPCPSSILPVFIVTVPSVAIAIHESIRPGSIDGGPMPTGSTPVTAARAARGSSSLGSPSTTTSAPAPLTKVLRLKALSAIAVVISTTSSRRHLLGGVLDRLEDPEVRAAAAHVRVHDLLDLILGCVGFDHTLFHVGGSGHDLGAHAPPALRSLRFDERCLQRVGLLG